MTVVNSWFAQRLRQNNTTPDRRFTIGSSDYSQYVLRWPTISDRWDEVRAANVSVNVSNADQTFNFFKENRVNLINDCEFSIVYSGHNHVKYSENLADTSVWTYDTTYSTWSSQAGLDPTGGNNANYAENGGVQVGPAFQWLVENNVTSLEYFPREYECSLYVKKYAGLSTDSHASVNLRITYHDTGSNAAVSGYAAIYPDSSDYNATSVIAFGTHNTVSIEDVGSDWLRCTLNVERPANVSSYDSIALEIGKMDTNGDPFNIYDVTSFYIWGVQVASASTYADVGDSIIDASSASINYLQYYDDRKTYYDSTSDTLFAEHEYSMLSGSITGVKWNKGGVTINVTDKLQPLTERTVGTEDTPVTFSGTLVSDIAWTLCTCYGALDSVQSTSNVDIDYDRFSTWAGVFSADTTVMSARFTGQKVSNILSRIMRMTRSSQYRVNNKIAFSRFTIIADNYVTLTNTTNFESEIELDKRDVVNRHRVYFNYDVDSRYYNDSLVAQESASVNSYGLIETEDKDQTLWYTDSASALNLAQRITFTNKEPPMKGNIATGINGYMVNIGDMMLYTNSNIELSGDSMRIMSTSFNMNDGVTNFKASNAQILNAFILDVTSLDGTEVLS